MSDTTRHPGALVRARGTRLGLSQRAAAHLSGIPQSMLSRIESGQTQRSVTTLTRVLEGLGAELYLELRSPETGGEGRREKQRSLWLNQLVVGELSRDPDRVLAIARDNITRWRDIHAERPLILAALERWSEILGEGVEAIVSTLTGQSEAEDLRPERSVRRWARPGAARPGVGVLPQALGPRVAYRNPRHAVADCHRRKSRRRRSR